MSTTSALGNVIPPASSGIPSALGKLASGQLQPSIPGFENFLPTGMTSFFSGEVASLSSGNASAGLASSTASSVQNSDLPSAVILQPAKITGTGAALAADAPASVVGTSALPANLASDTSFTINGTTVNLKSGMTPAQIVQAINTANNGQPPTGLAAASLDSSNDLVLTGADAKTSITISGLEATGTTVVPALGLADGTTTPTNLLTQKAVSAGQTLTVTIGSNPPLTITFGTDSGDVATLADLSSKLSTLVGGIASVDANGDISITAGSPFDTITVGGTASAATFGIQTTTAAPPDQLVVNNNSPTNPSNAPPPTNSPTNPNNAPPPTNGIWWGSGSSASNTTSTNMPMTLGNEMAANSSNSSSGNTSRENEIASPTSIPTTGASGTSTNASMPWGNEIAANGSGPTAGGLSNALTADLINSYSASALYVTLSSKIFDGLA